MPPPKGVRLAVMEKAHVVFVRLFRDLVEESGPRLDREKCHSVAYIGLVQALPQCRQPDDDMIENTFQTLMQYEGRTLSERWIDTLSRQIAARLDELRTNRLLIYERPVRDEWVPVEILEVTPTKVGDKRGMAVRMYCLAGHPAGYQLTKTFPENWLAYLAYQIGFSTRIQYNYDCNELVGLRMWASLKIPPRLEDEIIFDEWGITSRLMNHNKSILKLRNRFDILPNQIPDGKELEYSCPLDKDSYCSDCTVGVNTCIASPNREQIDAREPRVQLDEAAASDSEP